jgi:hypothetical protein
MPVRSMGWLVGAALVLAGMVQIGRVVGEALRARAPAVAAGAPAARGPQPAPGR